VATADGGEGQATISSVKPENRLSCAMDLLHFRMASTACSRSGDADLTDKRLTKNL
jgi:hypothetical protein